MKTSRKPVVLTDVKNRSEFVQLIKTANNYLEIRGYTEHGYRHVGYVSNTTSNILAKLQYDTRTVELGAIAGWIHDIGNSINRFNHGISGANLAFPILLKMGMPPSEIGTILTAIGNHEAETGIPANPVGAALILADKSDAHRTRVHKNRYDPDDIHDRVNYSIKKNYLLVDNEKKVVRLVIFMDRTSSTMEYFRIYLSRMLLSEKAAAFLGCKFELVINGAVINNHKAAPQKLLLSKTETNVSEDDDIINFC